MHVMVFAPHPDDDVLGCGGSIVKHLKNGNPVTIVYITSGDAGDAKLSKAELTKIRESEAKSAANIMGVKDTIFLRLPDGNVEYSPENIIKISQILRDKKPDLIYVPHHKDAHRDHKATFSLVTEAVYRSGANAFPEITGKPWNVGTILTYEVWTPLSNYQYSQDITSVMETKIKAIKAHASQLVNVAYDEATIGLNRYRGALTKKCKYAECFGVVKINSIG